MYFCNSTTCRGHLYEFEKCYEHTFVRRERGPFKCGNALCPGHRNPYDKCFGNPFIPSIPVHYCGAIACPGHTYAYERCPNSHGFRQGIPISVASCGSVNEPDYTQPRNRQPFLGDSRIGW